MTSRTAERVVVAFGVVGTALAIASCNGDLRFAGPLADASTDTGGVDPVSDAGDAAPATPCGGDQDCHVPGLRCDVVSGACVVCVADIDCTGSLRRCDQALKRCVECNAPFDCPADETCQPTTRQCVASCADGGACPTGGRCDVGRGNICVECAVASECARFPDRRLCESTTGRCVQCLNDEQCPTARRRCDALTGLCVACLSSSDCPAATPVCEPATFTCVPPRP